VIEGRPAQKDLSAGRLADISAPLAAAKTYIALGDDANVLAVLDSLISDFNDHPGLTDAVFMIGEEYYNKALNIKGDPNLPQAQAEEYYRKALAIWERIITELPDPNSTTIVHAYYFLAVCYRGLGNHEKAIEYFEKVVNSWPDYQYAWSAQCLIGECYEKLRDANALTESEANPLIERAYKAVIEKYPACSLVGHSCLKLAKPSFQKGQWSDAAMYFEIFLEKSPDDPRLSYVLYDLGRAYEKMGELDMAAEVYRTFIELADPTDPRIKTVKAWLESLKETEK
jgi:tetratricopeptide (TPR) repeat protein